jgi:hypothetical protein
MQSNNKKSSITNTGRILFFNYVKNGGVRD